MADSTDSSRKASNGPVPPSAKRQPATHSIPQPTCSSAGGPLEMKPAKKKEYELRGQGLFVIVKQMKHLLQFPTSQPQHDWRNYSTLDYRTDVKRLLETFNLVEGVSPNLESEANLTSTDGEKSYDSFMLKVIKKHRSKSYSFVMFFLLSHGFEDGVFLLSSGEKNKQLLGPCCGGKELGGHSKEEGCHGRHIVSHVIEPINEAFDNNIPKVFVIQTCRGLNIQAIKVGQPDSGKPNSDTSDLFIPSFPNTFVLRASVEGNISWVNPVKPNPKPNPDPSTEGSLLIRAFCDTLIELKNASAQYEALITHLYTTLPSESETADEQELAVSQHLNNRLCVEDITDGWLMSVCQRAANLVSSLMVVYKEQPQDEEKPIDKQQPHIISTLTHHLSCLKLLKTQQQ